MNDETRKLLIQMADALDGARTWIDNMETGSHARSLPAVDVVEYMPNNITGRGVMHDLSGKARRVADMSFSIPERVESDSTEDAKLALGMAYHAMHNELAAMDGTGQSSPMLEFQHVKLLAQSGEDNATILLRLRRPDKPDAFLRLIALDETR